MSVYVKSSRRVTGLTVYDSLHVLLDQILFYLSIKTRRCGMAAYETTFIIFHYDESWLNKLVNKKQIRLPIFIGCHLFRRQFHINIVLSSFPFFGVNKAFYKYILPKLHIWNITIAFCCFRNSYHTLPVFLIFCNTTVKYLLDYCLSFLIKQCFLYYTKSIKLLKTHTKLSALLSINVYFSSQIYRDLFYS